MTCIEANQESSSALLCILSDLLFDCTGLVPDSSIHSFKVCILVALDLVFAEPILLDAFLKLVSPLSGLRHVSKLEFVVWFIVHFVHPVLPLRKLWELSELVVADVVEDKADLVVRLEEASDHARVVEDLGSPFY